MTAISRAEVSQWDSVQKDIKGSIMSSFDELFKNAHLVRINTTAEGKTYIYFDEVVNNSVCTTSIMISSRLFKVKE